MSLGAPLGSPSDAATGHGPTLTALAALPASDRVAVLLVYFYGRTQAEIAAELAVSRAEVKRRVARALLTLGDQLLAHEGAPPAHRTPRSS